MAGYVIPYPLASPAIVEIWGSSGRDGSSQIFWSQLTSWQLGLLLSKGVTHDVT